MENEEINFTQKTQKNIDVMLVTINAVTNLILTDICLPVNIQTVSMEIWRKSKKRILTVNVAKNTNL